MRLVRHAFPLGLLALAALPAAAGAEILDIQAERAGDQISVLFVFDSQPADASITVSGTEAQATIAGAHGSGRLLRPDTNGLRQISIADRPLGLSVGAVAQRPILSAEAQVFQNAVLFRMTLSPDTAEAAAAAPPGAIGAAPPEAPSPAASLAGGDAGEPPAPEQFAAVESPEAAAEPAVPAGPTMEESAAALAAALEAAALEADALEDGALEDGAAPAETDAETETALAEAAVDAAGADAAEDSPAEPTDPQWAQGDALWPDPGPLSPSEPGAASELLAAQLDRTACDAAAATVSADPWALDALYNHGACLARDGHRARAQEVFERLASFDPASARTMVALGVLRQDEGDRAAAQDYYEQAMATAPGDGLAVLIRMLREL